MGAVLEQWTNGIVVRRKRSPKQLINCTGHTPVHSEVWPSTYEVG